MVYMWRFTIKSFYKKGVPYLKNSRSFSEFKNPLFSKYDIFFK